MPFPAVSQFCIFLLRFFFLFSFWLAVEGIKTANSTTKSHHTTNITQEIGRETNRRVAISTRARNSRELDRIRPYTGFLGKGVELSSVEIGAFHV